MRKFILISALLLASVSAQAGETRSLSLAGVPTVAEAPKPIAQVSVRLAQAATTANDAAPIQVQAPAPVQAQAPAPVQTAATTTTTTPAATTTTETKPATTTTGTKATSKRTKKTGRESYETTAPEIYGKYA